MGFLPLPHPIQARSSHQSRTHKRRGRNSYKKKQEQKPRNQDSGSFIPGLSEEQQDTLFYGFLAMLYIPYFWAASHPKKQEIIMDYPSPPPPPPLIARPKALIEDTSKIVEYGNKKLIFRTKFSYKSKTLYQDIRSYDPSKVYLINAANATFFTGGSGTNEYLTNLINHRVDTTGQGDKNSWGEIKDRTGTKWAKNRKLKVGEYAISVHPSGVVIVHIIGPDLRKTGQHAKLPDLSSGIEQFLDDISKEANNKKPEVIIFPAMSTGVFSNTRNPTKTVNNRRQAYQANIDGIENAYKKGDIGKNTLLAINWWDLENKDTIGLNLLPTDFPKKTV